MKNRNKDILTVAVVFAFAIFSVFALTPMLTLKAHWKDLSETPTNEILVGELLYEETLRFTEVIEYGEKMESVISGEVRPVDGYRADISFEGNAYGGLLKGTVKGTDYIEIRPNGEFLLDIKAELITEDGVKIFYEAEGVLNLDNGQVRQHANLTTSSQKYAWVNPLYVWVTGIADFENNEVHLKVYSSI